jgi:hypothetical protein
MVDFKMMAALQKGEIQLDMYDWVLGMRPKLWMENQGTFYMKYSHCVRTFHTDIPSYAQLPNQSPGQAATNFSCGHMATHFACKKMKATEVHLYGFDSIFDMDLTSFTDVLLESDRGVHNTHRLANNWRPIWPSMFKEFKDTKFVLHHHHKDIKIEIPENVEISIDKRVVT